MSTMYRTLRSNVMAGTDAADSAMAVWPYTETGVLERAYIEVETTVAAHGSNTITVSATQNSTTIFSRATDTAGGALTGDTAPEQTFGATMVGDKLELEKGEVVTFAVAKGGTGPAYELNVVLVYRLVN